MRLVWVFPFSVLMWHSVLTAKPLSNTEAAPPALLLAQVYQAHLPVSAYLVSEKLDGMRAMWDGKQLISRQGHVINAPAWFTQGLPPVPLDGELWAGRGRFEALMHIVRPTTPDPVAWQQVRYYIFELPQGQGDFAARATEIKRLVQAVNRPHLQAVPQFRVKNHAQLQRLLQQIVQQGGEGLMLHRADAMLVTGRSHVLLKLKPQLDAEATVIAHLPGKGKYTGKLGALLLETPEGVRFKLGIGLTDAERADPPPIGSQVTYTYRDLSKRGKPKFARYLRLRPPETDLK